MNTTGSRKHPGSLIFKTKNMNTNSHPKDEIIETTPEATKRQILQIGEGCDIRMIIDKNIHGIYFVHFVPNGTQGPYPVYCFNNSEEIMKEFGDKMIGKKVTI